MKKSEIVPIIVGGAWLLFLAVAYLIPVLDDSGANYEVYDSLLGIIIFHNLWIFAGYLFAGIVLIAWGFREKIEIV